jgi:16S rRNA (cytosine1402-N4)-methyltransferase
MPVHQPVMTEQVLAGLRLERGGRVLDATLGEGGHTAALARAVGHEGLVIGLDRDPSLVERTTARLAPELPQLRTARARFSYMREVVRGLGVDSLNGVLMDLGICSAQLDDGERGFAFLHSTRETPLDMRMDPEHGESAADLLARVDVAELTELLRAGDVPAARRTAEALLAHAPLRTIGDLLDAISTLRLPARKHHPATLVFQALRMAVNDEIAELETGLEAARDVLAPGGRLAVLAYHSGEDGRVKQFLTREARGCICPPALPLCGCGRKPTMRIVVRGQGPDEAEVRANPRARSARLRVGERL